MHASSVHEQWCSFCQQSRSAGTPPNQCHHRPTGYACTQAECGAAAWDAYLDHSMFNSSNRAQRIPPAHAVAGKQGLCLLKLLALHHTLNQPVQHLRSSTYNLTMISPTILQEMTNWVTLICLTMHPVHVVTAGKSMLKTGQAPYATAAAASNCPCNCLLLHIHIQSLLPTTPIK